MVSVSKGKYQQCRCKINPACNKNSCCTVGKQGFKRDQSVQVSRGINLSACGAVLILTIAKLLTEYYVLFDLGENIAESGSALTYLIYYVLKPCMFIIKMSAIVLITVCIVDAILSWFGPSPIKYMSSSLLMPIYRQMRKFIPPIGMVDITPMILLFGLYLLEYLVETLLSQMFSASFAFFLCSALV